MVSILAGQVTKLRLQVSPRRAFSAHCKVGYFMFLIMLRNLLFSKALPQITVPFPPSYSVLQSGSFLLSLRTEPATTARNLICQFLHLGAACDHRKIKYCGRIPLRTACSKSSRLRIFSIAIQSLSKESNEPGDYTHIVRRRADGIVRLFRVSLISGEAYRSGERGE